MIKGHKSEGSCGVTERCENDPGSVYPPQPLIAVGLKVHISIKATHSIWVLIADGDEQAIDARIRDMPLAMRGRSRKIADVEARCGGSRGRKEVPKRTNKGESLGLGAADTSDVDASLPSASTLVRIVGETRYHERRTNSTPRAHLFVPIQLILTAYGGVCISNVQLTLPPDHAVLSAAINPLQRTLFSDGRQRAAAVPHVVDLGHVLEGFRHLEATPFAYQLHAQVGQHLLSPRARLDQFVADQARCLHTVLSRRRAPHTKDAHDQLVELVSLDRLGPIGSKHDLKRDSACPTDRRPLGRRWLSDARVDLVKIGEDGVVGVFHGAIHSLSVAFGHVGEAARWLRVLPPGEVVWSDGRSIDRPHYLVLLAFDSPVSLDVVVEMLLLAVAGEALGPTCRADDDGVIYKNSTC